MAITIGIVGTMTSTVQRSRGSMTMAMSSMSMTMSSMTMDSMDSMDRLSNNDRLGMVDSHSNLLTVLAGDLLCHRVTHLLGHIMALLHRGLNRDLDWHNVAVLDRPGGAGILIDCPGEGLASCLGHWVADSPWDIPWEQVADLLGDRDAVRDGNTLGDSNTLGHIDALGNSHTAGNSNTDRDRNTDWDSHTVGNLNSPGNLDWNWSALSPGH